ncbi:PREDICTED: solute carrier family 22 member 7-like [Drosophila arizonae]|uniref:Solute carrier family 22 member 7-like n=1 Tax=Drosophila arizonae TaxID=7263 RepID=A0ABM1P9V2_DROAR|nr:PREDICTED: solute carrier family 22 member 7-like [Drosophila arizonae]
MDNSAYEAEVGEIKEDATATQDSQLEAIIVRIGDFGRFQMRNYVLLCLPIICSTFHSLSFVFTASTASYRCFIGDCDTENSSFIEPWLNFTIPRSDDDWDQCNQYQSIGVGCDADTFNSSQIVSCESGYKLMDDDGSIATEFGIYCSNQWQLSMVGTVSFIAHIVGMPMGGYFSDRYGRKATLVVAGVLSAITGLARSHTVGYYSFLLLEFLSMFVGSPLFYIALLLAVELVGCKQRVLFGMIISLTYAVAEVALGYLASLIRNWRVLLRVIYTPALLHLLFICYMSESVRWLLSQSRELEAVDILRDVAIVNQRQVNERELSDMVRHNRKVISQTRAAGGHYTARQIYNALGHRTATCCGLWLIIVFISMGLTLNSMELYGDKYRNFGLSGLVKLPGVVFAMLLMNRLGRRWTLNLCMGTCSISLLLMVALINEYPTVSWHLFFLAQMANIGSHMVLIFFTAELFPTSCRSSLLALCYMIGRIGAMLAPSAQLLISYYKYTPHLLFAALGIPSSVLSMLLPETSNETLPTTMEQACALDLHSSRKSSVSHSTG